MLCYNQIRVYTRTSKIRTRRICWRRQRKRLQRGGRGSCCCYTHRQLRAIASTLASFPRSLPKCRAEFRRELVLWRLAHSPPGTSPTEIGGQSFNSGQTTLEKLKSACRKKEQGLTFLRNPMILIHWTLKRQPPALPPKKPQPSFPAARRASS